MIARFIWVGGSGLGVSGRRRSGFALVFRQGFPRGLDTGYDVVLSVALSGGSSPNPGGVLFRCIGSPNIYDCWGWGKTFPVKFPRGISVYSPQ